MADEHAPTPALNEEALGRTIGNAVADGIARTQPRRKITFGEYDPKTYCHPNKATAVYPKRACFQNGFPCSNENTTDAEARLLNQITHSGRYLDRFVEVVVRDESGEETVDIRWPSRTIDQRLDAARHFRSFLDCLEQIVKVQIKEDKEDEEMVNAPSRRHFGNTKEYREARARAEG